MTILAVIPVLARPKNAVPLVESFEASSPDAQLLFVCTGQDESGQVEECLRIAQSSERVGVMLLPGDAGPGDYAAKIQAGYDNVLYQDSPFVLCGADDLRFHPRWDRALLETARTYDVGVVGTNDLANPSVIAGRHATHPLVARCYIDRYGGYVGGPGQVYFGGYHHWYVDVELVETAKARGCYAHCHHAVVEHLHPIFRRDVATDATYLKGRAGAVADAALYQSRRRLWELERVPA